MNEHIIKGLISFILILLLQILLLNNIEIFNFVIPYFYVLYIIMLPFFIPKVFLLITAFLMGISIDLFFNTIGLHASSTLLIAFLRPFILDFLSPRDGYDSNSSPCVQGNGIIWFVKYSFIILSIHHFVLFYLEAFSIEMFFYTFIKALIHIVVSFLLILFSQLFIYKR